MALAERRRMRMEENKGLLPVEYGVTEAGLSQLREKYRGLVISDSDSYEIVRKGIAEVRTLRTSIESRRKELKASALEYGRRVDGEAKRITEALLEIESPMKAEKDRVDAEREAKRKAKEEAERKRVDGIRGMIEQMRLLVITKGMSAEAIGTLADSVLETVIDPEVFQEFTEEAVKAQNEVAQALLKAQAEQQKWESEEAARKAEAERLETQRKEQEEAEKKLQEERRALEREKKALQEAQERARIEAAARQRAEAEAREKLEREAREAAEAKEKAEAEARRREAARPDRDKLEKWADELADSCPLDIATREGMAVLDKAWKGIRKIIGQIRKEASEL
jgi:septal ring factor EnvC (AmiA/AmiB activator)